MKKFLCLLLIIFLLPVNVFAAGQLNPEYQTDEVKAVEEVFVDIFEDIALGRIESTDGIKVYMSDLGITSTLTFNSEKERTAAISELNEKIDKAIDCAGIEYPQYTFWHSFWHPYTAHFSDPLSIRPNDYFEYEFHIRDKFKASEFKIKPEVINSVQEAITNAQAIVDANVGKNTYDKLMAYAIALAEMVDYDESITSHEFYDALDNNPNTNTVCDGMARAFKLLCDMSDLGRTRCVVVGGLRNPYLPMHAWNHIAMDDGKTYLIDITEIEDQYNLYNDLLELDGQVTSSTGPVSLEEWLSYSFLLGRNNFSDTEYTLDENQSYDNFNINDYILADEQYNKDSLPLSEVNFYDDGKLIQTAYVPCHGSAEAPEISKQCHTLTWDHSLENIIDYTLNVNAVWTENHTWGERVVDIEPTCISKGESSIHCTQCDARKDIDELDVIDHNWIRSTIPASCTTEGSITEYCSHCKEVRYDEVISATGHIFGEWEQLSSSTCSEQGETVRSCTSCGYAETEYEPLAEHTWEDHYTTDVEPTCLVDGSESIHCSVCEAVKDSQALHATGHTFGEWYIEKEATCQAEGNHRHDCIHCDEYETLPIAKTDHSWDDHYTIDTRATCETEGSESIYCSTCDAKKESRSIQALGHILNTTIKENTVHSTCKTHGHYDEVSICARCGKKYDRKTVELPLSSHSWGNPVTKAATYDNTGSITETCAHCGKTNVEILPKLTANISACNISYTATQTYTSAAIKPAVTIKIGNKTLKNGTDYTLAYSNNINVGTGKIVITGKGQFKGSATKTFKINAAPISKATVTGISNKIYTGKAHTQSPVIKYTLNGKSITLKLNTDYTITYKNNTKCGTATVVITGKGKFSGTLNKTFKISSPEPINNRTYVIVSAKDYNYALDVAGGSYKAGANIDIYKRNNTEAQAFTLKKQSDGSWTLVNYKGMGVAVASNSKANSANVLTAVPNTSTQKFNLIKNSDGTLTFKNKNSGKVLDIKDGTIKNSQTVQQYASNNSVAQKWVLVDVTSKMTKKTYEGTYTIRSAVNTNYTVDIKGGSKNNSANTQLYKSNNTSAQKFILTYRGSGYYTITNKNSGRVLDVSGGKGKNGQNVQQYNYNGSAAQLWKVVKNSDGTVTFKSAINEKFVLDLSGGKAVNSQNIHIYTGNNSKAQKWVLK